MFASLAAWSGRLLVFSACVFFWRRLLPEGGVSETVRRFFSVCLLLIAFLPLLSLFGQSTPPFFADAVLSAPSADAFLPVAESAVRDLVEPAIRKYTTVPYSFDAQTHITPDGGIDITVVRITFDEEIPDAAALTGELIDLLGPAVEICFPKTRPDTEDGGLDHENAC